MDNIIVAIISGVITLVGVLIANGKNQAIVETKLEHLTEEVKKHNNFASRIPKIEGDLALLDEKIKVANHRIDDLEHK